MVKDFFKKHLTSISVKLIQINFKVKLLISLFLSGIIFSVLGFYKNDNSLNNFYLYATAFCFELWWSLLPIAEEKKDKIFKKTFIYFIMSIITAFTILFWIEIYFNDNHPIQDYIIATFALLAVIIFLLDVIETLFKAVILIINNIWSKIFKQNSSPVIILIKNITAIIATLTAFITSLIGLIRIFVPNQV